MLLLLLLQLFEYVHVGSEAAESGEKIIGGRHAVPNAYRFVVSVQRMRSKEHMCGGVLVTEWHVLSACSCMIDRTVPPPGALKFLNMADFKLVASGTDAIRNVLSRLPVPDGSTQAREIKSFHVHPQCRRAGPSLAFADDLMVFFPLTAFNLVHNVHPMNLYSTTYKTLNDKILDIIEGDDLCEVAGYGVTSFTLINTKNYSTYLNLLDVKLVNNYKCTQLLCLMNSKYCEYNPRKFNQICAIPWFNTTLGSGACTGDIGGPLVCKGYVYGILSWSLSCGNATFVPPMMFQSLDRALDTYKDIFLNARSPHIKSNVILMILCILIRTCI